MAITEADLHITDELKNRIISYEDVRAAYEKLLRIHSFTVVSTELVCETHENMFRRTRPHIAGKFKEKVVEIRWVKPNGDIEQVPTVPAETTHEHVTALCDMTNLRTSDKAIGNILLAAEFCCDILAIHPFLDGNGRLSRMLCGYLLKRTGYYLIEAYPFEQIILVSRSDYYKSLNHAQSFWRREEEDLTQWIDYFIECLCEHARRAKRSQALSNR